MENKSKAGRAALLATAFLTLAVLAFCGGWFAGSLNGRGESFSVSAETRSIPMAPEEELIDLNSATAEELQTLHGIGEALAGRIIAYREEHGPFQDTYEIMDVSGIGYGTFEQIRDKICVKTDAPQS